MVVSTARAEAWYTRCPSGSPESIARVRIASPTKATVMHPRCPSASLLKIARVRTIFPARDKIIYARCSTESLELVAMAEQARSESSAWLLSPQLGSFCLP